MKYLQFRHIQQWWKQVLRLINQLRTPHKANRLSVACLFDLSALVNRPAVVDFVYTIYVVWTSEHSATVIVTAVVEFVRTQDVAWPTEASTFVILTAAVDIVITPQGAEFASLYPNQWRPSHKENRFCTSKASMPPLIAAIIVTAAVDVDK